MIGGAGLALALALQADPTILLPPWPLSPDGDLVGVTGDARLEAEGARLEPLAPGLWRAFPRPGSGTVRLSAGAARATAEAEPAPGRIEITARPALLVKNRDSKAAIDIALLDARGRPDAGAAEPEIACSAGSIGALRSVGPGRFTASYEPPTTRHPELAVLTAMSPRCPLCPTPRSVGTAVIPLHSAIDLPGRTDPGVSMSVEIGGKRFGPVAADPQGRFRVPIVVPPGERFARGFARDRAGNVTRSRIDLKLPPVHQLACVTWPRVLPADGRSESEIVCTASEATGKPAPRARLRISAGRGRVTGLEPLGNGAFRARYTAPRGGAGNPDRLVALFPSGGPASRQEIEIALAHGPPVEIGFALEREPVPVGSAVPARTWTRDAWDDLIERPDGSPGAALGFVAPDRFVARPELGDGAQMTSLTALLAPCSGVARITLRRRGGEWLAQARCADSHPAAGVKLVFGSGAEQVTDARGEARAPAQGQVETVRNANGTRAVGFTGLEPPEDRIELVRTFAVPLRPASPVDVLVALEPGRLRWRVEDRPGHALPGRAVRLHASGPALGPAHPEGEGGWCTVAGRGTVAVIDVETGVSAVLEVR